ncbi:MAG TPA: hypothetical protein VHP12_09650, partial [Chitinophagaceae bacterium]|nr:hypothetical protein [Chitinophagaceae bacterium]
YDNSLKKLTAMFLLVIFMFSITPKRVLHSIFANHTDSQTVNLNSSAKRVAQIFKSGFNCQIDSLVVESSFLQPVSDCGVLLNRHFSILKIKKYAPFAISPANDISLRGPPFSC